MSVCFVLCRVYTDDQTDILLEAEDENNTVETMIDDHDNQENDMLYLPKFLFPYS